MRFELTGGQVNEISQAIGLTLGLEGRALVGDRAYDSDAFLACVAEQGMAAVIPARANRRKQRALDARLYALRNVIERFFGRLKAFRRVATRYDETAASYAAAVALASSLIAISGWDA